MNEEYELEFWDHEGHWLIVMDDDGWTVVPID